MTIFTDHAEVNPVVAEVVRSGFAESRHHGAVTGLAADGTQVISVGRTGMPFFPRSANKPLQAAAILRCGLGLDGELLALAAASHSGEDFHADGVRKILSEAGLSEDDLHCPLSWPLDIETGRRLVARGHGMSRIRMNCSGKHAAMLATCVQNGWPTRDYLDPDHPLQQAIRHTVEELAGEQAAASHSGEDFHADGVRKSLSGAGLSEDDLRCPLSWPLDIETGRRLVARGHGMSRIRMNCSGKHAAMLATCVQNGWPTRDYLIPDHPLQQAIRHTIEELADEQAAATGVDGCGAPLFALTMTGLARAFRALVLAAPGTPERRVADAMRAHPEWTSGTNRDERKLMDAVPGLLVKAGAEGVNAFALDDGRCGAVKIDDGSARARTPVTVAALRLLGIAVPDELAIVPLTGGEAVVGAVRAIGLR